MRTGDFGILSRVPCGPPCFQGIRPGVTTFDEAALILKNAGFPCSVEDGSHGKVLLCSSGDTQITIATAGPCTPESTAPMVGAIGLTPPDKITVDEFIGQYGPPDLVMTWLPQFALAYPGLQAFVVVAFLPGQLTYTFTSDTAIGWVVYVTTADYQACLEMWVRDEQPWKGYGTYKPNP